MKSITLLIIAAFLTAASFTSPNQKGYRIIGAVTGFADSTLLYLGDVTDGSFKKIDSTYIMGGKFLFTGSLKTKAMHAGIRTADFSSRTYFWLENATIHFTAEKEKFREAIVRGSKTQDENMQLRAALKDLKDTRKEEMKFVRNNPSSIISAYILSVYASVWGKDTAQMLYNPFSNEIKNTFYGQKVKEFITLNKEIKIGGPFADFAQNDTKGKLRKLSDLKGKVILLEFWGSWCGPCRKGNPELVKIYNEYNQKGFEIFGVAADSNKEDWLDAVTTDGLPWINVCDLNGDKNKAALIYGVSYYPTNWLIDRSGKIVARDVTGDALREKLKELL